MSTQFYNTVYDHSSDATFRSWGSAFSAALIAAGIASTCLTQTADTGQINWTTVVRPGISTVAGYEMYRLTDTLDGTTPLFIKIEYGTGSAATIPQMWITIGTATNGAGTITANASTRTIWTRQTTIISTSTPYPTYISSNNGSLTIAFKLGSGLTSSGFGYLGVGRPCNLDASLRSDAIIWSGSQNSAPGLELVRVSDGTKFGGASDRNFCLVPQAIVSSAIAATFQVFQHIVAYPAVYGINWQGTIINTEIGLNTSDTATLYGASAHTYVSLGATVPNFAVATGAYSPFMLYE